jgi:signal transduction histidine kinase
VNGGISALERPGRRERVAAEAGLAVLFVATLVFWAYRVDTLQFSQPDSQPYVPHWQFGLASDAVVCALALARHWAKVWVVTAGLLVGAGSVVVSRLAELPGEPGPAAALALAVLVGSGIRTLPVRSAILVSSGGFVVALGGWLFGTGVTHVPPSASQLDMLSWLAGVLIGVSLRWIDVRQREAIEAVRRSERLDLARELHDMVAHHVTGMVLQAQAARLVADSRPEQLDESLAGIEAAGSEALTAMRRVVGLLRDTEDAPPAALGPEGLRELVDRFAATGPPVLLDLPDGEPAGPPEVASTVYRVVRESLTNVARHAPHAGSVTVHIGHNPRRVTVAVVDDAMPARAPLHHHRRGGYGLVGMRERVEALGGTLHVGPTTPGPGWAVHATLPVDAGDRR